MKILIFSLTSRDDVRDESEFPSRSGDFPDGVLREDSVGAPCMWAALEWDQCTSGVIHPERVSPISNRVAHGYSWCEGDSRQLFYPGLPRAHTSGRIVR
jgi:hypothetical protein